MKRRTCLSACLGWFVVAGLASGAVGEDNDLISQSRKNRQKLVASQISALEDTHSGLELDEVARRARAIFEEPVRKVVQVLPPPGPDRPDKQDQNAPKPAKNLVPGLSPGQLARLKELSPKSLADPPALADVLFLGGHWAEAGALYQRIHEDAATEKRTKAWALFQMANCRRRRDPAAAIVLYSRLVTDHPQCSWVKLATTYKTLLEWYQAAKPEGLLQPQQTKPTPQATRGETG